MFKFKDFIPLHLAPALYTSFSVVIAILLTIAKLNVILGHIRVGWFSFDDFTVLSLSHTKEVLKIEVFKTSLVTQV